MTTVVLPDVLITYFEGVNQRNVGLVVSCFKEDATVHDEKADILGIDAIRAWVTETQAKYQYSARVKSISYIDGQFTVSCEVSGDFPGSPIDLDYRFTLQDGKIASLYIN